MKRIFFDTELFDYFLFTLLVSRSPLLCTTSFTGVETRDEVLLDALSASSLSQPLMCANSST